MSTSATTYSARIRFIELLEREQTNVSQLRVYKNGSEVVPSSGTYTLFKPSGSKLVDGSAVDLSTNYARFSHSSVLLSTDLNLEEGYLQEWALVVGGEDHIFRRPAAIVRRKLYPVVTDQDLNDYYSDLNSLLPSSLASTGYQTYIDSAWFDLLQRISSDGVLVQTIIGPEALRACHVNLTLAYIFRDYITSVGDASRFFALYEEHKKLFEQEYKRTKFRVDLNEDGIEDNSSNRANLQPILFTSPSGRWRRRR